MSTIVTILLIIAAIIALVLILAAMAPKGYSMSRSIVINRTRQQVFDYVRYLRNQDNFNVWVMKDPNMKKEYRGTDGIAGFVYAWDGNKQAGAGEQELKAIEEGNGLDIEVRFIRPFAGIAATPISTEAVSPGETKLTWSMSSKMPYPMNAMLLFINMDKLLGKDLETSLGNLKTILEQQ